MSGVSLSENQPLLAEIFLLFADLVKLRNNGFTSFSGPGAPLRPSRLPFFSTFQHWAIQVRHTVYEVTANDYYIPLNKQHFNVKVSSIRQWERRRDEHSLRYEKIKLGLTELPDRVIEELAYFIWRTRFQVHPKSYDLNKQNCQNFAFLLYGTINIDIVKRVRSASPGIGSNRGSTNSRPRTATKREWQMRRPGADGRIVTISKEERASWKPFPIRYTEYVQVGKLIRDSPFALVAGSYFLSAAGKLVGPSVAGFVKETALDVVRNMSGDVIMLIGVTGAYLAIKVVEKRSRDVVWLKEMKKEVQAIVDEAEMEHVF